MDHNNFIVNKYYFWYYKIISNRITNEPIGYVEKHHIIPKCLGGTNSKLNLVKLTAREHFICHVLLTKMTKGEDNKKMRRALGLFKMVTSKVQRPLTSTQYQIIRTITSNLPNPMYNNQTKAKHLDSIARKYGYDSYQIYVSTIKSAFERYKTIKYTAEKTGHCQYTIRHLLLNNFGKEWVESIREVGIKEGKHRSIQSNRNRTKRNRAAEQNFNAYVWEARSPLGETFIIKGNRLNFCKQHGIGSSLDPQKPHLRSFWEFKKLCKVKDYEH